MGLIFDTGYFIRKERCGEASLLPEAVVGERCGISVITVSELLVGAYRATQPDRRRRREAFVSELLEGLDVFDVTVEISRRHAEIVATLGATGLMIGAHDLLIAATALHLGWSVVTANEREFRRVAGLDVLAF